MMKPAIALAIAATCGLLIAVQGAPAGALAAKAKRSVARHGVSARVPAKSAETPPPPPVATGVIACDDGAIWRFTEAAVSRWIKADQAWRARSCDDLLGGYDHPYSFGSGGPRRIEKDPTCTIEITNSVYRYSARIDTAGFVRDHGHTTHWTMRKEAVFQVDRTTGRGSLHREVTRTDTDPDMASADYPDATPEDTAFTCTAAPDPAASAPKPRL